MSVKRNPLSNILTILKVLKYTQIEITSVDEISKYTLHNMSRKSMYRYLNVLKDLGYAKFVSPICNPKVTNKLENRNNISKRQFNLLKMLSNNDRRITINEVKNRQDEYDYWRKPSYQAARFDLEFLTKHGFLDHAKGGYKIYDSTANLLK